MTNLPELPPLKASVNLTNTKTCLTLTHGNQLGEFFLDTDGQVDLWQLDEFISKLIADVADKTELRNKLLGK